MKVHNKNLVRVLRREATWAEEALWRQLRNRKLLGAKFRRQQPVGPYVLDFFCPAKKLAVEIDGGQHDMPERREHDQKRTVFLEERGIGTLRFWNSQIRENLSAVLERIRMELQTGEPPHPRPLPQGERELGAD